MRSSEKIRKVYPTAYCEKVSDGYRIKVTINEDTGFLLSNTQTRESWAWAEAVHLQQPAIKK